MQVRRLVSALRPPGRSVGVASSAHDSPLVDACQQLTALFAEHPQRRSIFLAEDGLVALIELLEERSHKASAVPLLLVSHCWIFLPQSRTSRSFNYVW